jgi:hypothetical protein
LVPQELPIPENIKVRVLESFPENEVIVSLDAGTVELNRAIGSSPDVFESTAESRIF